MDGLFVFIVLAILAEAVWENVKLALPFTFPSWVDRLVVMVFCVFLTVSARLDLLSQYDVALIHPIGAVISGIVISRGANFFHDVIGRLQK